MNQSTITANVTEDERMEYAIRAVRRKVSVRALAGEVLRDYLKNTPQDSRLPKGRRVK